MKLNVKLVLISTVLVFNCLSLNDCQDNIMDNNEKHTIIVEEERGNIDEDSINEYSYTEAEPSSIVDKWRQLYEQGKNIPIRKNVEHINQTFETLKTMGENVEFLLSLPKDNKEILKAIELLMKIDLGLTNECYSSLTHLFKAFSEKEIWALKCK